MTSSDMPGRYRLAVGFIVVALVVGVVLGLLRGGDIRNLGAVTFRWWPLLVGGIAVQGASSFVGGRVGIVMLVASYGLLIAFAAANLRFAGMGLMVVGIAMNASTIAVNEGMPVRAGAIVAAGIAPWDDVADLNYGTKRHLERESDRLMALSDIIPVPYLGQVLSFGDLALGVGVADLLVHLLRGRRRPRGLLPSAGHDEAATPGASVPTSSG